MFLATLLVLLKSDKRKMIPEGQGEPARSEQKIQPTGSYSTLILFSHFQFWISLLWILPFLLLVKLFRCDLFLGNELAESFARLFWPAAQNNRGRCPVMTFCIVSPNICIVSPRIPSGLPARLGISPAKITFGAYAVSLDHLAIFSF